MYWLHVCGDDRQCPSDRAQHNMDMLARRCIWREPAPSHLQYECLVDNGCDRLECGHLRSEALGNTKMAAMIAACNHMVCALPPQLKHAIEADPLRP